MYYKSIDDSNLIDYSQETIWSINHIPVIALNYSTQVSKFYLNLDGVVGWVCIYSKQTWYDLVPVITRASYNLNGNVHEIINPDSYIASEYDTLELCEYISQGDKQYQLHQTMLVNTHALLHYVSPYRVWGKHHVSVDDASREVATAIPTSEQFSTDYAMLDTYTRDYHISRTRYLMDNPTDRHFPVRVSDWFTLSSDMYDNHLVDGNHRLLATTILMEPYIQIEYIGSKAGAMMLTLNSEPK